MPTLKVNNLNMYYEQTGKGPDVVFISGLSADHTMWDLTYFKDSFRVLTFDNRGAGQTDVPEVAYGMDAFIEDTVALCQELGIKKAHFVGHSMGGHIVQYLAANYRELVNKAVIACSEQVFSTISYLATNMQVALRQYNIPKKLLIENYLPVLFSMSYLKEQKNRDNFVQSVLNNPYPQTNKGYIGQVEAIRNHDTTHLLAKIKSPSLVIGCEEDLLTPYENSIFLANHIPHARLATIKNCGHAPFIENPNEFFKLIASFLSEE
ncbi:alpha/beta fold hydrolase [Legionella sp. D16C41]|uniref:alpha/beta fold hydrolase n=1 Tax=Legionella sp. D16C41 TaxID=3402688 RepID=UPI003AF639EC